MDQETITLLRTLCSKVKEIANLCDSFLEQEAKKQKKTVALSKIETPLPNRLIPLTKWPEFHHWPTVPALRYYALMRHRNGFERVLRRVGKRLLIDEKSFFEWVEGQKRHSPK